MKKRALVWIIGSSAAFLFSAVFVTNFFARSYATVYWQERCGDGMRVGKEGYPGHCDDGNNTSGDGCSANCLVEQGASCGNAQGQPSKCTVCGNSRKENGEQCDDGNLRGGDGCAQTCSIENDWSCAGKGGRSVCNLCGNAKIEGNEKCDLGVQNGSPDSYCRADCTVGKQWKCSGQGSNLQCNSCGNGVVESGEACDDSNGAGSDGCSAKCVVEKGYTCTTGMPAGSTPSTCSKACGNGTRDDGETCDLGQYSNGTGAGCSAKCAVEKGWTCNWPTTWGDAMTCTKNTASSKSSKAPLCGNGVLDGSEKCDTGGWTEGCSAHCTPLSGWKCTNPAGKNNPSMCVQTIAGCGNGKLDAGEQCDFGSKNGLNSGCTTQCKQATGFTCRYQQGLNKCYSNWDNTCSGPACP